MMLRPRWVLALLAALGVAAAFAILAQWQVGRAVEEATVVERPTEQVRPLAEVARPDGPTDQSATGQRVSVRGTIVPGDTVLVQGRLNDGVAGWWVVAHLEVTDAAPGGLPVALGWAADEQTARDALADFEAGLPVDADMAVQVEVVGRFLPSEAPVVPAEDDDPNAMTTVAVAHLINVWADYDDRPVYFGYVTAAEPVAGLEAISSPPPEQEAQLNWLNVFYAIEWVVFAGFAVFLWYRLVKDAVQREREEAELAAAEAGAAGSTRASGGSGTAGGEPTGR
ncbi:Cytochrome oxidase assembly protein ShyY1 [Agromyces flavus]|nr:Cytochrome oxidase assembly protein ShyY1 [Agromyces flavus]